MRDKCHHLGCCSFDAIACKNTVYTADFSPYLSLWLMFAVLDKGLLREGISSIL